MKNIILFLAVFLISCHVMAQQTTVIGTVTDGGDGSPLIGANVLVKGTAVGTITDLDGNYKINLSAGENVLIISCIGYKTQEITLRAGQRTLDVVMKEDSELLDEVVVVGYGVQKKKLVTGATIQVNGDNIQKLSTTSTLGALQSQTPGVNITQSSGQPGENFKVVVRGMGTIGNSSPLYVIDGVPGGDINALNPSDVESIDVLKDAASAAIYGARAANGVILVTTKQGKAGKMQLSYDGFYGIQNVYKILPMLTAKEYMAITNEGRFNSGNSLYDFSREVPVQAALIEQGAWNGTNWLEEIRNSNAPMQSHAFNLTGGTESSTSSVGFSYTDQEGTFGVPVQPFFQRYTARLNSDYVLLKGNGFNIIKIGENLNYMFKENHGIGIGNIYWNDIHNMIVANPLMPVYNADGNFYNNADKHADRWSSNYSDVGNQLAQMVYRRGQNASENHSLQANAYIEIQPIKGLTWKSSYGYKMNLWSYRSYTNKFELSDTDADDRQTFDKINQQQGYSRSWTLENTLNYNFRIEAHTFDALIGQSVEKWGYGSQIEATNINSIFPDDFSKAYLSNGTASDVAIPRGYPSDEGRLASFFGRVNYNYKETYMASLVMRADGSSNFARRHRWGYFPSFSAGWVMTNEYFMEGLRDNGLDFLKPRASWGQNGNSNISNFQYLATITFDDQNSYFFNGYNTRDTGAYADILPNPDVTWETSEQLDLGLDARVLNSRLGINFDWFQKNTKNWLVQAPILASYGTGAPYINGGDIRNTGLELGLNWNDDIGGLHYGITFNASWLKNEVTRIANSEGIIHGDPNVLIQGMGEMYRAEVGMPIGYFYGFKTAGIFQNQDQIDNTLVKKEGAVPGDVIFVNNNGDTVIDEKDRTMIGNPFPDVTTGLNINLSYKNFDFSVTASGNFGQQIAKGVDLITNTTAIFDRWHGEGTSNALPRLGSNKSDNWGDNYASDLFIENGDFVKIANVTLGYDFKKLYHQIPLSQVRLYVAAQNLYTFTKYSGMDPEIGYGYDRSWVQGIDLGFFPSPRTFLVGVNLKF
ncbi:MAG: TonB-dependent receptor [Mediterranea sp.]|jgi:TonB-linked SusC/RagA family outer membrane protein|nr:TonB-dependent receptor [Mediterranea sp.]